jgi:type 1 glutamine amidotransferase
VTRIVILSGVTGTDDPWHDFTGTSLAIAGCLSGAGWSCDVVTTSRSGAAQLAEADLLVVNSGRGSAPGPDGTASDALLAYLASGRPVLGVHASANTFPNVPEWAGRLGVAWIEGTSMHPPIGWSTLTPAAEHDALRGLDDVTVFDELYSFLRVLRPADVLLSHRYRGVDHPLVLAREDGHARTVYDALGHGLESYASLSRRQMLGREVRWLLG